jgi:hypothetical protein
VKTRRLLISAHEIVRDPTDKKVVIGQVRCREDVEGTVSFWQARTAEVAEWFGEFATAEEAIDNLKGV